MRPIHQDGTLAVAVSSRDHAQGSLDAKVMLVEYGDYRSPGCKASHQLIQAIQAELSDCVCYVFRHYPQHSQACKIAEAVEAAHVQGQFWQMHQKLLERSATLSDADLVQCAIELNLDVMQFLRDLSDHCHVYRIHEDVQSGRDSGVRQVPTFFLNGTMHPFSIESLRFTVESLCFPNQE